MKENQTVAKDEGKYIDDTDPQSLWYGVSRFKQPFTYKKVSGMINQRQSDILKEKEWQLDMSKYTKNTLEIFQTLFLNIQQNYCNVIKVSQIADIPKHIQSIKFVCLIQLSLIYNQIVSIESMVWVDAPNLLRIDLDCNMISNFKPLTKMNLQKVLRCQIGCNYIKELDAERLRHGNFSVQMLSTSWKYARYPKNLDRFMILQNTSKLAKSKSRLSTRAKHELNFYLSYITKKQGHDFSDKYIQSRTSIPIIVNKVVMALNQKFKLSDLTQHQAIEFRWSICYNQNMI